MSSVTQEHYRAQNVMHATDGFTFESGVLTAAQARVKYNLILPSHYKVSADGQVWYTLLYDNNMAQLGFTNIAYDKQPEGYGWNDAVDNPYDEYYIRQEMQPDDNVDISTYLAELQLNSTAMFMKSPIGNAMIDDLLIQDGEPIQKINLYNRPLIQLVIR